MSKYGMDYEAEEYKKVQRLKNSKQRSVFTGGPNETFAIDLIFIGERIFLNIVDVFTRKLWSVEVPNKKTPTFIKTLSDFFIDLGVTPTNLWIDGEGALASKEFQSFVSRYNMKTYQTYGEVKNPVVERMNRTQKENVIKDKSDLPLEEKIQKFNKIYNDTQHSATGQKPNEIYGKKITKPQDYTNEQLLALVNSTNKVLDKKEPAKKKMFKVGDKVKVLRKKGIFEKGYEKNFLDEVFIIEKVEKSKPVTYYLKDKNGQSIEGAFYQQQLLKA